MKPEEILYILHCNATKSFVQRNDLSTVKDFWGNITKWADTYLKALRMSGYKLCVGAFVISSIEELDFISLVSLGAAEKSIPSRSIQYAVWLAGAGHTVSFSSGGEREISWTDCLCDDWLLFIEFEFIFTDWLVFIEDGLPGGWYPVKCPWKEWLVWIFDVSKLYPSSWPW